MRKSLVFILMLIFILSNCSKKLDRSKAEFNLASEKKMNDMSLRGLDDQVTLREESPNVNDKDSSMNGYENMERKRIKRGEMSLEVKDLRGAEKIIGDSVNKYNGYIASSNYYQSSLYLVLKIPAYDFDNFLTSTESIGKLINKSVNVEDVTQNYFDLESKLKNKRILQERYQSYLKRAANTKELLEIERALNNVTGEIEQFEGSFRLLNHQISYSTLNLNLSLPVYENITRSLPSLKKGFQDLGYNIVEFFYVIFFIILYIFVFGVPLVLVIGVFYFIGFGKIGLIRKFFSLLSSKK